MPKKLSELGSEPTVVGVPEVGSPTTVSHRLLNGPALGLGASPGWKARCCCCRHLCRHCPGHRRASGGECHHYGRGLYLRLCPVTRIRAAILTVVQACKKSEGRKGVGGCGVQPSPLGRHGVTVTCAHADGELHWPALCPRTGHTHAGA